MRELTNNPKVSSVDCLCVECGGKLIRQMDGTCVCISCGLIHDIEANEFKGYFSNTPAFPSMEKRRNEYAVLRKEAHAQPLDSKILTSCGWKQMVDIKIDDLVVGRDGNFHKVIAIYPLGVSSVYRVTFSDGCDAECSFDHLWNIRTHYDVSQGREQVLSLCELMKNKLHYERKSGVLDSKYFIPIVNPIHYSEADLFVHPYLLGVLLGDGCLCGNAVSLATAKEEMIELVKSVLPTDLKIIKSGQYRYYISQVAPNSVWGKGMSHNSLTLNLKKMELWNKDCYTKFVPDIYKFSSVEQRINILQGLMDTDGSIFGHDGEVRFTTTSSLLADGVVFLVQSLGGVARTFTRQPKSFFNHISPKAKGNLVNPALQYVVDIMLPKSIEPFKLSGKLEKYRRKRFRRLPSRSIKKVKYIGEKPVQCIAIDSKDGLYLTDSFIVTHNTLQEAGKIKPRQLGKWIEKQNKEGSKVFIYDDELGASISKEEFLVLSRLRKKRGQRVK